MWGKSVCTQLKKMQKKPSNTLQKSITEWRRKFYSLIISHIAIINIMLNANLIAKTQIIQDAATEKY